MTALSNFLENELIDHILRDGAYTSPGTEIWITLYTDSQDDADAGTEVLASGAYVRVNVSTWDAPADGATANTGAINWPQATASWGTVTSVGIKDSCSSTGTDNLLLYGDLDTPKPVTTDDTFTIPAGDLDVTLA